MLPGGLLLLCVVQLLLLMLLMADTMLRGYGIHKGVAMMAKPKGYTRGLTPKWQVRVYELGSLGGPMMLLGAEQLPSKPPHRQRPILITGRERQQQQRTTATGNNNTRWSGMERPQRQQHQAQCGFGAASSRLLVPILLPEMIKGGRERELLFGGGLCHIPRARSELMLSSSRDLLLGPQIDLVSVLV